MINVAVCDDDRRACDVICSACKEILAGITDEPCSVAVFLTPDDMLRAAEKCSFDLILCDVYMPGILGTDAVQELRDAGDNAHVIFITSSKDHAVDAFALHADNYLVKPFTQQQLTEAVAMVMERILKERRDFVSMRTVDGSVVRVDFAQILFVETKGHNQLVKLADGGSFEVHVSSQTMFTMLEGDSRFFKAGSSYIINLDKTRSISAGEALMMDETVIPIPIRIRKTAQDAFFERTFSAF